uniref:Uncharacterized protein n=1 Tax=Vannella robusta TaxID=1487602 RepID=A0A7S4MHD0_9EUKA|mmetsp:Transcript_22288/g.28453  ORF Transcript_22288/g.28453 Transcript_22288/m.28453 type:complete len:100 (+) Transcript_22288:43-342(+)
MLGNLLRVVFSVFMKSGGPEAIERNIVNKLANNEAFQRVVVSTNRLVDDNRKKVINKLQNTRTFTAMSERGSPRDFVKEFAQAYKEEIKKEFSNGTKKK